MYVEFGQERGFRVQQKWLKNLRFLPALAGARGGGGGHGPWGGGGRRRQSPVSKSTMMIHSRWHLNIYLFERLN